MAISEDQLSPIQAIAARADALMAHTGGNLAAAAVASSLSVVAAATASSRSTDRKKTTSQPHRRDGDRRPQTGDRRYIWVKNTFYLEKLCCGCEMNIFWVGSVRKVEVSVFSVNFGSGFKIEPDF